MLEVLKIFFEATMFCLICGGLFYGMLFLGLKLNGIEKRK